MCGMEYKVMGDASWQTRAFVEDIVKIMERKGMTRLEFARRLGGVRPSYVTKILSGGGEHDREDDGGDGRRRRL